jgi:hypothetical protein
MKKNVFWMALISLVVMMSSTVFTSCSDDDDEKSGSLVGTWGYGEGLFVFDEDGTLWITSDRYDDPWTEECTYVYKDGVIYIYDSYGDLEYEWKVIKLTASELVVDVIYEGEGSLRATFKREK